jgi:Zn-dependent peptidase ImmA (M78 family)
LLRSFWAEYVNNYLRGGNEVMIGDASVIFTEDVQIKLSAALSVAALATPVLFTERLSNRLLATCLGFRDGSQLIAINARFKVDPELMAHTLVEEFVHAQQRLDGIDFAAQQQQYLYADRPFEQEAKRFATNILGYEPDAHDVLLLREQPQIVIAS